MEKNGIFFFLGRALKYCNCFCVKQICANLDSVIVSTKNYEAELKEAVPRPMKNYDIVDERYWVCLCSS